MPGRKDARPIRYRGTELQARDIARICQLIRRHREWGRSEVALNVCRLLDWRQTNGAYAVRSAQTLLKRMDRQRLIALPESMRRRTTRGQDVQQEAPPSKRATESIADDEQTLCSSADETLWPTVDWTRPLVVRLLAYPEVGRFVQLMRQYHYLGHGSLVGESLRYVATVDETWVALLSWSSASLHNRPRDGYIGWDAKTKHEHLHQVINNSRFLILPWARRPNLASQILSKTLRQLNADWQAIHRHGVCLAETFVDCDRFYGGCYRASNWQYVGTTTGFGKRGEVYTFHGTKKAVFVYPLHRDALPELRQPITDTKGTWLVTSVATANGAPSPVTVDGLDIAGPNGLLAILATIPDVRKARGKRFSVQTIVAMAVCATLTGAKSFMAIYEWAKDQSKDTLKRLGSRYGRAPDERTFRRVLQQIDVTEIDQRTGAWVAKQQQLKPGDALACDGKLSRGSRDGEKKAVHLLSAVVHGSTVVVAQTEVPEETNEITRMKALLEPLDITGCTVTADAIHTQTETARHIVEDKKADYLLTVKDNQPSLREAIDCLQMEAFPPSGRDDR